MLDEPSRAADWKSRICVTLGLLLFGGTNVLGFYSWTLPLAERNAFIFPWLLVIVPSALTLTVVALHDGYKTGAHHPRSIFFGLIVPVWLHVIWVLYYFLVKRPKYFRKQ